MAMMAPVRAAALVLFAFVAYAASTSPPNIVFIVVDDLNPSLNSYNFPTITPNLDRLATISTQFRHAYVSVSVCA